MNNSLGMFSKRPWLTLIAVLALALGIGAATVAFSFNDALVYRPFRFTNEERVVQIWEANPGLPNLSSANGNRHALSPADFLDLEGKTSSFEAVAGFRLTEYAIQNPDGPGWEQGTQITQEFFKVLQDPPFAGRALEPADFQPGSSPVIVVDSNLSRRLYKSEAGAVGQTLTMNYNTNSKIVGAMGPDFAFPPVGNRLLVPMQLTDAQKQDRLTQNVFVIARVKPDVSMAQAQQELDSISNKLAQQYPQSNTGRTIVLAPLSEWESSYWRPLGGLYLYGSLALLLLGCATVTALLVVKGTTPGEAAVFSGPMQIVNFGIVLSLLGGVLGTVIAYFAIEAIRSNMVENITWFYFGWKYMKVESHALLFAAAITVGAMALIGIFTALLSGSKMAPRRGLIYGVAVAQCVAAVVLLVAGGVMRRNTMEIVWQYESRIPEHVLTMGVALPPDKYPTQSERATFYNNVVQAVGSVPGVESVAVSDSFVGTLRRVISKPFEIAGRQMPGNLTDLPLTDVHTVSSRFFETMHLALVAGRNFGPQDGADAPPVVMVNETMARLHFSGESPIGKQIHVGLPDDPTYGNRPATIIGVVPDTRQFWLMPDTRPKVYFHSAQQTLPEVWLLVRAQGDPMPLLPDVRKKVFSVDSERPLYGPRTWYEASIFENLIPPLMFARILLWFGAAGLFCAAIALYSATLVSARKGVREAVARPSFAAAFGVLALGAILGIVAGLSLRSDISAALLGVGQFTSSAFILATVSLLVMGAIGAFLATRNPQKPSFPVQAVAKAS